MKKVAYYLSQVLLYEDEAEGDKDMRDIVAFGIQLMISTFLSIMSVVIIALLRDCFIGGILYLIVFCTLRRYAGGYHASNSKSCIGIFSIIFWSSSVLVEYVTSEMISMLIFKMIVFVLLIVFWLYAPMGTLENPLPESLMQGRKRKAVYYAALFFVVLGIRNNKRACLGLFAILWCELLLIIGQVKLIHCENDKVKLQVDKIKGGNIQ